MATATISGYVLGALGLALYAVLVPVLVSVVDMVVAELKETASPYAVKSDVTETLWKIPSDTQIRYKHGVVYYNTSGREIDKSIHYSIFV